MTAHNGPEIHLQPDLKSWPVRRPPLIAQTQSQHAILRSLSLDYYRQQRARILAIPGITQQLFALARAENPDLVALISTAQRDPAITSELIRLANSPLYRGVERVHSIKEAVVRLGVRESLGIALVVASKDLHRPPGGARSHLWMHLQSEVLTAAYGASWLSRRLKRGHPPTVFLAGLFFQVGKLAMLQPLVEATEHQHFPFLVSDSECLQVLNDVHVDIGCELLSQWNMPPAVIDTCKDFSDPNLPTTTHFDTQHLVRVFAGIYRQRHEDISDQTRDLTLHSLKALRFPPDHIDQLHKECDSLIEKVKTILQKDFSTQSSTTI